jgi:Cu-processing system permease protein
MTTIIRYTWIEIVRKRLVHVAMALTLIFLVAWGALLHVRYLPAQAGTGPAVFGEALAMLYVGLFFAYGIIAVFSAFSVAGSIGGDADSGLMHSVLSRPLSRASVLLGKWAAYAGAEALYVVMLVGAVVWLVHARFGAPPWSWRLLGAVGLMVLEAWTVSAVAMLGSVVLSPLANGVMVMGLFFVVFLTGVVAQIPPLAGHDPTLGVLVTVGRLVFPADGLYRRAVWEAGGGPYSPVGLVGLNPLAASDVPGNAYLAYALVYIGAVLWAAVGLWRRRDV